MTSEVFRFVTVRPPQDVNVLQPTAGANIDLGVFPTSFTKLDASLSFAYRPVTWTLTFNQVSWVGRDPAPW